MDDEGATLQGVDVSAQAQGWRDHTGAHRATSSGHRGKAGSEGSELLTDELRTRAEQAKIQPSVRMAQVAVYVRDAAVAEYAKRRANGSCDLCGQRAPFQNTANEVYLECHHIVWLAKGGEDATTNTVALCPNCHRKMHVLNKKADIAKLTKLAVDRISEERPEPPLLFSCITRKALPDRPVSEVAQA